MISLHSSPQVVPMIGILGSLILLQRRQKALPPITVPSSWPRCPSRIVPPIRQVMARNQGSTPGSPSWMMRTSDGSLNTRQPKIHNQKTRISCHFHGVAVSDPPQGFPRGPPLLIVGFGSFVCQSIVCLGNGLTRPWQCHPSNTGIPRMDFSPACLV